MPRKETVPDKWKDLPMCVCLNPVRAGMFDDTELSGLSLIQGGGQNEAGEEIKSWGHVPKDNNCVRVQLALGLGILVVCKPGGESTKIPPPEWKGKLYDLMGKPVNELVPIIEQSTDSALLKAMKDFEDSKVKKERRPKIIAELTRRLNKSSNVTAVKQSVNFIKDNTSGKMVRDIIKVK